MQRERQVESGRERGRETERQRDWERGKERNRERERQRERKSDCGRQGAGKVEASREKGRLRTAAGAVTRAAPSLPPAIAACGWQFKSLLQLAVGCLPCQALHSPPPPLFNPHSCFHCCVCCWIWPCYGLCIASFAAFCGRRSSTPPPPLLLPECCPLVRPYAKQLQRQQLLRSWLLHCKCECDCDSESETATRMTTTTVSDAECNLSKKSRQKLWQHAGRGGGGRSRAAETTLCFGINMSAIKLICVAYG